MLSPECTDELSVERRQEERFQTKEEVQVTRLGDARAVPLTGHAIDLSGRGLSLTLAEALPAGAAVRVDRPDRMMLGEVAYCVAEAGAFRIGIEVEQSLRQTRDLAALRRALHAEAGANADGTMKKTPHDSRSLRPEAEAPGEPGTSPPDKVHIRRR
jgi:hypothetical protein